MWKKPDRATAEHYLASGHYFWNSGMFIFFVPVVIWKNLRTLSRKLLPPAVRPWQWPNRI
ncbi:sugar phosphate nucleotidyltransferase [Undibacterium arcticum]